MVHLSATDLRKTTPEKHRSTHGLENLVRMGVTMAFIAYIGFIELAQDRKIFILLPAHFLT
ncbi:MAG: hypothetical protein Fur0025_47360 [Oscillatoriaceae cyanobacterium]